MVIDKEVLTKEIMWEYNCVKSLAENLISAYQSQNRYGELCEAVAYKRTTPDFRLVEGGQSHVR